MICGCNVVCGVCSCVGCIVNVIVFIGKVVWWGDGGIFCEEMMILCDIVFVVFMICCVKFCGLEIILFVVVVCDFILLELKFCVIKFCWGCVVVIWWFEK